jgi:hypothetical protein
MELDVFYSRPEKLTEESMTGCLKTLNFITFPEITKVLQILDTIPITMSEAERYQ